ncbi:MAG: serine protease, partial [Pseudomonadota bacterium]
LTMETKSLTESASSFARRQRYYRAIEQKRQSRLISYITSDRPGLQTQIAADVIPAFVEILDEIGPVERISLLLHTDGGHTSTAWRLINLVRSFCEYLEVIVPTKAMSAGTLISLGANCIVMTKQAALGPIDPSITHPLGPRMGDPDSGNIVPVSVEAVRGYIDFARDELNVQNPGRLSEILDRLSQKVHPLVLGEIFRSRTQIRFLANKLLTHQNLESDTVDSIVDFLCADSGSHDYTINRREAEALGLTVEKPSSELYQDIKAVHSSYTSEMALLEPYSPEVQIGTEQSATYTLVRGLVEQAGGTSYEFVTAGKLARLSFETPAGQQRAISDERTFEGWRVRCEG